MNKAIIALLIVLAAFFVVAENADKYNENNQEAYNSQDFYEDEPVENWKAKYIQADKIPEDKVNKLNSQQLSAIHEELSSGQLKQLEAEQISSIIQKVDSTQLSKMNPETVDSLSREDAEKYFNDKLTSDGYSYKLKNSNERRLLKKIDAFSKVDFQSMQNIDDVEVGNVKTGNSNGYNINTPAGTVFLDSAANVEHTEQGLSVTNSQGNGVVMTRSGAGKGTIHVDNQGYRMDSFEGDAPYKIKKSGQTVCGVKPPYNSDIASGSPVYVGFGGEEVDRPNYVSVGENNLKARTTQGDMGVNIPQDPPLENYQATAGEKGKLITTLNKNGEEYKIVTTPDGVDTKGEESPFPVNYNQVHNPDQAQGVKIKQGETKVRDMDGGWWGNIKDKAQGVLSSGSDKEGTYTSIGQEIDQAGVAFATRKNIKEAKENEKEYKELQKFVEGPYKELPDNKKTVMRNQLCRRPEEKFRSLCRKAS